MNPKKWLWLFRILKFFLRVVYPKLQVVGIENVPEDPCVVVGNHAQMHGPIACELYLPEQYYTWCAGQMMHLRDVPPYAYADFWSKKPKSVRWFYKIASYLIAPLCVLLFNNARTIAVYHDTRILTTFRETIGALQSGKNIVIFPEHDEPFNNIIYDFQDKFIDLAKHYHKRTGKELSFLPMYVAPNLKQVVFGRPVQFCATENILAQREKIRTYLMNEITEIGRTLPEHTVVPYANDSKKLYPCSKGEEGKK